MSLGERLKHERERLGYSQADFAELVGASRKSQIRWEKNESSPGADALMIWSDIGLDVIYLISGAVAEPLVNDVKNAEIDEALLGKIVSQLELIAQQANRRWSPKELVLQSAKIYNFLIKENSVDEKRIENVLKLIVNH